MLVAIAVIVSVVTIGGATQNEPINRDAGPNNSIKRASTISYGAEINGTLSLPDDVDYYSVRTLEGDAIIPRLRLKNMFEGSAIMVDIVRSNGEIMTEFTNDQISGPKNVAGETRPLGALDTAYTADVMGPESEDTYYIRVREASAPSDGDQTQHYVGDVAETSESDTYQYNLTVSTEDIDDYDPNENGASASPINLGKGVEATLTGYDNDVYAINLTAGQSYDVRINAENQLSKQVNIFDNASLASDEDDYQNDGAVAGQEEFVEDATVTFIPAENGTYYVELTESPINPDLLGRSDYTITVIENESTPDNDAEPLLARPQV